eukprot:m.176827 g.176827  ORF g.176827 m.176827 type:complete len:63 (-) comp15448_c0_seq21:1919-2107(-)
MVEKAIGKRSQWEDYFQSFPSYCPIPILWSKSEKQTLYGLELYDSVQVSIAHVLNITRQSFP